MVSFKDVVYIPHKHIYRKIYDRYKGYLERIINYPNFRERVRVCDMALIYLDNEEMGFVAYIFNPTSGLLYVNYLVLTKKINFFKELYRYFLNKGYFINGVAYYRYKKNKYVFFKLGG